MNRGIWKSSFKKSSLISWHCPHCAIGALALDPKTFVPRETKVSREGRQHEAFDYDWIKGRFVCMFICARCDEVVACVGTYELLEVDDRGERDYIEVFTPKFFQPSPDIITIPARLPEPIAEEIRKAFQLYWNDPPASANRIRSVVEILLDHLKVKKQKRAASGSIVRLTLHERIIELKGTKPDVAEQLLAVKWLGNAGSHSVSVERDDILDGLEILEKALDDIFVGSHERIQKQVSKINKNKGPVRRATRATADPFA